jgi:hypothetical protein
MWYRGYSWRKVASRAWTFMGSTQRAMTEPWARVCVCARMGWSGLSGKVGKILGHLGIL